MFTTLGCMMRALVCHRDQRLNAFVSLVLYRYHVEAVNDAGTPAAALDFVREGEVDMAFVHITHPNDPFLDAISGMRRACGLAGRFLPVVVTMDEADPGLREAARSAGADECVVLARDPEILAESFSLVLHDRPAA